MQKQTVSSVIAGILFAAGLLVLLSILLFLVSESGGFLVSSGNILFQSFSYLSFYIPVYLFLSGYLTLLPVLRKDLVIVLCGTALPFLVFSAFLKIALGKVDTYVLALIVEQLDKEVAMLLLFLTGMIFILILTRVAASYSVHKPVNETASVFRKDAVVNNNYLSLPDDGDDINENEILEEVQGRPFKLAEIPEAPKLRSFNNEKLLNDYQEAAEVIELADEAFVDSDDEETIIIKDEEPRDDLIIRNIEDSEDEDGNEGLWGNPYGDSGSDIPKVKLQSEEPVKVESAQSGNKISYEIMDDQEEVFFDSSFEDEEPSDLSEDVLLINDEDVESSVLLNDLRPEDTFFDSEESGEVLLSIDEEDDEKADEDEKALLAGDVSVHDEIEDELEEHEVMDLNSIDIYDLNIDAEDAEDVESMDILEFESADNTAQMESSVPELERPEISVPDIEDTSSSDSDDFDFLIHQFERRAKKGIGSAISKEPVGPVLSENTISEEVSDESYSEEEIFVSGDNEVFLEEVEELVEEQFEEQFEEQKPQVVPPPLPADVAPATAKMVKKAKRKKYEVPAEGLLDLYPDGEYWIVDNATKRSADVLTETLKEFKIEAEVTGIRKGPVITMFEILPAPGVKLSKIVNLADNIALRLAASRIRIVAPIPGKHAVGIEVPNKRRSLVSFREMVTSESFKKSKHALPIILGKDITGEANIVDLTQTPHLLIAGATGSGKSVCVNSIICSLLYGKSPDEVRILLIDPKIVELKLYNDIPHLLTPVITEPKKAFQALQYCIYEMERRYSLLDSLGVRDIKSFNKKIKTNKMTVEKLPYLVVIVDEFADLMATTGKELESTLARLAAMSRAVGIHLVLATQRPSIDVITGLIKANIPSRIAFMVAGKFDSRIIIDGVGAEKLLGKGDMLFTSAWDPNPVRIQGAFLTEEEVEKVAEHIKTLGEPDYIDDEIFLDDDDGNSDDSFNDSVNDPLMNKALEIVVNTGKASASYLQRRLKIGYNRAARIVEDMEARGIVGPPNGSKPREVIHVPDRFREQI